MGLYTLKVKHVLASKFALSVRGIRSYACQCPKTKEGETKQVKHRYYVRHKSLSIRRNRLVFS